MSDDRSHDFKAPTDPVSPERVGELLHELTKRLMVVTDHSLSHLQARGVVPLMARDGCCKPDGGTCCVNKK
jgi:hypothetical protein